MVPGGALIPRCFQGTTSRRCLGGFPTVVAPGPADHAAGLSGTPFAAPSSRLFHIINHLTFKAALFMTRRDHRSRDPLPATSSAPLGGPPGATLIAQITLCWARYGHRRGPCRWPGNPPPVSFERLSVQGNDCLDPRPPSDTVLGPAKRLGPGLPGACSDAWARCCPVAPIRLRFHRPCLPSGPGSVARRFTRPKPHDPPLGLWIAPPGACWWRWSSPSAWCRTLVGPLVASAGAAVIGGRIALLFAQDLARGERRR